jgi:hypothetical protein
VCVVLSAMAAPVGKKTSQNINGQSSSSSSSSSGGNRKLSSDDALRDAVARQNREQDASGHAMDIGYLNDTDLSYARDTYASREAGGSKLSSKRAMSMAGGIDHLNSNMRAEALESELQQKRKAQKRVLYDEWKTAFIANMKKQADATSVASEI